MGTTGEAPDSLSSRFSFPDAREHLIGHMSAFSNRTIHDFKSLTFILELMAKTKKSNAEHDVHNVVHPTLREALPECKSLLLSYRVNVLITEMSQGLIYIK